MKLKEPITLKEVSEFVGGDIIGNPDTLITGINEIHKVEKGDLTYVDFQKYYKFVLNSKATSIIIDKEVEPPQGKSLLLSDDPFSAYNKLTSHFRPFQFATNNISPTAKVGEGTIIQPGVFVGNHVRIGKNCLIHPNVTIYDYSEIGDNVIIHANTVIGSDAFYYKGRGNMYEKMHTVGRAIVHDDVEIGANCSIASGVSGDTIIGKGSKLDNQIHIGHGSVLGEHCLLCGQVAIAGKVNIGNHVILYGKAAVSKALSIGDHAVILASSNVGDNLEGGKAYFGSPAVEARIGLKQIAAYRRLPEIWDKVKGL